jgi:hypothetical protein
MIKALLPVLLTSIGSGLLFAQIASAGQNPLLRHYREGQTFAYHMKGLNEQWHYEIRAEGTVTKDSAGTYVEQYGWSHLISNGQEVHLPVTSLNFRQQVTLDPSGRSVLPDLSQVDPRLIGPITDFLTFYVDLWLGAKTAQLTHAGDHVYVKRGTPASWADGNHVLIGESSVDFDLTLEKVNPSEKTATLSVRHVPPEKSQIKAPADWMHKPVADTANNWVTVQKTSEGKFLAATGKETFDDKIIVDLGDGKILSATMDNRVETIERECADAALTTCGDSKPHSIRRQIEMSLQPQRHGRDN